MKPLSRKQKAFALMPLGILAFAILTIVAAYYVSFSTGQLEFYNGMVVTPPISMLMFAGPGRRIGQIGFPSVAILFAVCIPEYGRGLEREILRFAGGGRVDHQQQQQTLLLKKVWWLKVTSMVAFSFLAVVGIIPLQKDLPLVLAGQKQFGWDSILHQVSAGFFFAFSIAHMGLWLQFCRETIVKRTKSSHHGDNNDGTMMISSIYYYKNSPISFGIKAICFILCFLPLPTAFLLHPVSPIRKRFHLSEADRGGITQYALVTCVATFFASYTCELYQMMKQNQQQRNEMKSK